MVRDNYLHAIKLITNEIHCFCTIIRVIFYLFSVNSLEACYLCRSFFLLKFSFWKLKYRTNLQKLGCHSARICRRPGSTVTQGCRLTASPELVAPCVASCPSRRETGHWSLGFPLLCPCSAEPVSELEGSWEVVSCLLQGRGKRSWCTALTALPHVFSVPC